MTEQGKTAVADRVAALEMENTHLRRELFEMRQMARLREPADSWERLERDAAKDECEYAGAEFTGDIGTHDCRTCRFYGGRDHASCSQQKCADVVRRAKALAVAE